MKTISFVLLIVIGLSYFGDSTKATSQTYQQTTTVNEPYLNYLNLSDQDYSAGIVLDMGNVLNNIVIDPNARTIRESGSISLSSLSQTVLLHEARTIPGLPTQFPNPPNPQQTIFGDLTLTLSAGQPTFDTGVTGFQFSHDNIWSFNGTTSLNVPLNISYSLATGGQTYSGTIADNFQFTLEINSEFDASAYPTSIALDGISSVQQIGNATSILDFTANNGFSVDLTSQVIPEPSVSVFGGCSAALLLFYRRYQKSKI